MLLIYGLPSPLPVGFSSSSFVLHVFDDTPLIMVSVQPCIQSDSLACTCSMTQHWCLYSHLYTLMQPLALNFNHVVAVQLCHTALLVSDTLLCMLELIASAPQRQYVSLASSASISCMNVRLLSCTRLQKTKPVQGLKRHRLPNL